MKKKAASELIEFALAFIILSGFLGIRGTLNIIKAVLSGVNSILVSFYDTTILTVMFKYFITFPIVGVLLMRLGSLRGKKGHQFGKVLYFMVGYVIGLVLDFISGLIF
ncbi:MAG TPA: hypothetical protein IAB56_06460 [Candidatus Scybalousia intestinigallinarum]|nr:hypothetical protein [Candidatus Scybalousia intestinigallinarum]